MQVHMAPSPSPWVVCGFTSGIRPLLQIQAKRPPGRTDCQTISSVLLFVQARTVLGPHFAPFFAFFTSSAYIAQFSDTSAVTTL
ncbi:hypothetical protein MRS44_000725 [Fusarium solani]|jgi:hypothetical protein|uniref:uncharacterized protein n=1 Tax=Fusarium solani TaxID=169388 RepID=UPI0023175F62|nr:hypothetical protein MRS44_000725 [Fusarium solani]KAJ4219993.1 hypothetical protein NW759_007618 [Fusarium solani]